jgi:archaeosine-15-forming tRNA-guanine transglycosylase
LKETAHDAVFVELWVSLASLLRSYSSMHGLNGNRQATVELGEKRITVRHGDKWLDLSRDGALVTWRREDGRDGRMELMETGRLRTVDREEEMDMVANDWAQELMG